MDKNKKIGLDKDSIDYLYYLAYQFKIEERELALDRYRKQDEQIVEAEDFITQGKNLATFLDLAAKCSNEIIKMANEFKSTVYKVDEPSTSGGELPEDMKSFIQNKLKLSEQSLSEDDEDDDED